MDDQPLDQLVTRIADALDVDFAAVVRAVDGQWETLARAPRTRPLPHDLLAEALDAGAMRVLGKWTALPLDPHGDSSSLLVVAADRPLEPRTAAALAATLHAAESQGRLHASAQRRAERLEALLEITAQWNRTQGLDELLKQMAEAACRLLNAQRASIFLWDERTHELVGRPALGVAGGELRVPDDQGVVGRVLKTGQPVRAGEDDRAKAINRRVDEKLGFRTRNLLGVPLIGAGGRRFGVFEVLNRKRGDFTLDDETALVEFARHAAVAIEHSRQFDRLVEARTQLVEEVAGGVRLIGECKAIQQLRKTIARVAQTDLSVLVLGENGTGKEVVSRLVHYGSARRTEPLVAVNCAALPESLLESELFGHERGAFTDAREARAGKFELASRGTLFLDEIGDMSLGGQAKLLRVLEDKLVTRVGGSVSRATDTRVIAATNQDLVELVRGKRFREDLYFRLNVVSLLLPPLRERGDDVLLLAHEFLADFSRKARRDPPALSASAERVLREHPWPGNVRELRNAMERLAFLGPEDRVDGDALAAHLSPLTRPLAADSTGLAACIQSHEPLADATLEFQRQYIRQQIDACGGNMTKAAARLGLDRPNLYRKLKQLGLS
ncbi:MAG: sigma-54-dependent Fis family transcriptional regulator [Pirellulales bacterium]